MPFDIDLHDFPMGYAASSARKARNEWDIDSLLDTIAEDVKQMLPRMLKTFEKSELFAHDVPLLRNAVDRFIAKDYISTAAILYPRIEGLLRSHFQSLRLSGRPTSKRLVAAAIDAPAKKHQYSLLLPNRFQHYLENVYFENFDPEHPPTIFSRHTLAHGVAPVETFSLKAATTGLLILDQLSFFLNAARNDISK
jgi:hypothetical protein